MCRMRLKEMATTAAVIRLWVGQCTSGLDRILRVGVRVRMAMRGSFGRACWILTFPIPGPATQVAGSLLIGRMGIVTRGGMIQRTAMLSVATKPGQRWNLTPTQPMVITPHTTAPKTFAYPIMGRLNPVTPMKCYRMCLRRRQYPNTKRPKTDREIRRYYARKSSVVGL